MRHLFADDGHINSRWHDHNQGLRAADMFDSFDTTPHLTAADLCAFRKPGRDCKCQFCQEQVARERNQEGPV